jgi:hypothetical protein
MSFNFEDYKAGMAAIREGDATPQSIDPGDEDQALEMTIREWKTLSDLIADMERHGYTRRAKELFVAEEGEVAPAPEHDGHLLHWIACPDGSSPVIWTWNAARRSWHWYDLDIERDDGFDTDDASGASNAFAAGFRYLAPAFPPSEVAKSSPPDPIFVANRDFSGGSF